LSLGGMYLILEGTHSLAERMNEEADIVYYNAVELIL
jgi:hypothetical protein